MLRFKRLVFNAKTLTIATVFNAMLESLNSIWRVDIEVDDTRTVGWVIVSQARSFHEIRIKTLRSGCMAGSIFENYHHESLSSTWQLMPIFYGTVHEWVGCCRRIDPPKVTSVAIFWWSAFHNPISDSSLFTESSLFWSFALLHSWETRSIDYISFHHILVLYVTTSTVL